MMVVGCVGPTPEPAPQIDCTVTEEVFDNLINHADFLKPGQNKTVTTKMTGEDGGEWSIEMDGNNYHTKSEGEDVWLSINPNSYVAVDRTYTATGYYYEDGELEIDTESGLSLRWFANATLEYMPFNLEFEDFIFDESTQCYRAEEILVPDYELTNVAIAFLDDMLLGFDMTVGGNVKYSLDTTKIGETKVTLPTE